MARLGHTIQYASSLKVIHVWRYAIDAYGRQALPGHWLDLEQMKKPPHVSVWGFCQFRPSSGPSYRAILAFQLSVLTLGFLPGERSLLHLRA